MRPNLELTIDELVLRGFPAGHRYRIAQAIERELVRLFVERGVPPGLADGGSFAGLDGGAFRLAERTTPAAVGVQIAAAVYQGFQAGSGDGGSAGIGGGRQ